MDIQEARAVGAVEDDVLVDVAPLIDSDGVAVIPYGVTTIGGSTAIVDGRARLKTLVCPKP